MPEVNSYTFKHRELLETLIKKAGVHEGLWQFTVAFSFTGANTGPNENDISPCAVVTITAVGLSNTTYLAHRLAWVLHYGQAPRDEIDHINGDPLDNRIANLRQATRLQNCRNIGARGIRFEPDRGKWLARIYSRGKTKNLGRYDTESEARQVYLGASQRLRGRFSRAP